MNLTVTDDNFNACMLRLLDQAELQGFLTLEDVLEVLPTEGEADSKLDAVCRVLVEAGVTLYMNPNAASEEVAFVPEAEEESEEPASTGESDFHDLEDTVGLYMREMARVPLLSIEEEIDLAQRINAGTVADRALQSGTVDSAETIADLHQLIRDGLSARDQLIRANTRLVISVAKKYIGRGVPFQDLIQEGNLGLMRAVEKFDHTRGYRFSTYATWWIRQTISRAIADQSRLIRVPVHMADRIKVLYRTIRQLEQEYGTAPSVNEIAVRLDLDVRKVEWLMRVSWRPLSLEQPVGEEEDSELSAFIPDESTPTPAQAVQQNILREKIEEMLCTLPSREANILRLRFGLATGEAHTLEEVGAKFGLTRERIRQLENKALRRLRHPMRARQLRGFV